MGSYSDIESGIKSRLITYFGEYLDDDLCQAKNVDHVYQTMLERSAEVGCVFDMVRGALQTRPDFNGLIWVWDFYGVFIVKFEGDQAHTDAIVAAIMDKLPALFKDDPRLSQKCVRALVEMIEQPEEAYVNDAPVVWVPFAISILDK